MGKKKTDKSRYESIYGGKECYVTPAQYIVELICQKQSKFEKYQLPLKFWNTDKKWANIYKRWLRQTHKVLKTYDSVAIIRALKKSGGKWSLHTDFMKDLIQQEHDKLITERANLTPPPEVKERELELDENMDRVKKHKRKTSLDKLLDL